MAADQFEPSVEIHPDVDPQETAEWTDSLDSLIANRGPERAQEILTTLIERSKAQGLEYPIKLHTDLVNTISPDEEPEIPGDEDLEKQYRRWLRWNNAVMVHRAQRPGIGVGGHMATYASSAVLYETGFNHFFRGPDHPSGGDQIFIQGHAAPGPYARAFLEGRLTERDLDGFRQEKSANGLSSYPHPHNMPEFWQFPTVSMGIGPINSIYQAQFNRYLTNRGIKDASDQKVWAFLGDGEMDEVESRGQVQVAANENLDNLIWVVNCNLQRLDGPVRGNGSIVTELESFFRGAGWNVIKVMWGREWDDLLAKDTDGALRHIMNTTRDGDYQTMKGESGAYVREHFFGRDPRALKLVENYTDDEIWALRRGGHDNRKVYAAYHRAVTQANGRPTVILAHTIKGYGLGPHFEGKMAAHQMKKLKLDDLKHMRDWLKIPFTDAQLEENPVLPPYYNPGPENEAIKYAIERRRELGGWLPQRRSKYTQIEMPPEKPYAVLKSGSGTNEVATTMAFVRLLKELTKDKNIGARFVPIVPDEARTFGMDSYFPSNKIYNPHGQHYTSIDRDMLLHWTESPQGQIIHVGINEAGAVAAFTAAGTSYSTHGELMIPVYLFYSMFGFQRTGDAFWATGDQMARGFIIGATAGRTTLTGEGLQHADGHSPVIASTNPSIVAYDPAFGYEIAHIVQSGIERMYGGTHPNPNVSYYLTVYNEPIQQPAEPEGVDVDGIVRGIHRISVSDAPGPKAQILASGVAVPWALEAQALLARDWGVSADVWSVTSWVELRRDGIAANEAGLLNPMEPERVPYVTEKLRGAGGPFVAVTDYMHAVPDMIREFVPGRYATLGADGFGFSDTRAAARRFFKIDGPSTVVQVLRSLAAEGAVDVRLAQDAIDKYDLTNVNAGTTGNAGGDA